ncbi:MAG TPA: hypothetical protein VMH00_02975 [Candidatus Limnocylindrales bacterium]|nr:hypothetical protein [Candidatus Limnocylindrales bacterium]
MGDKRSDEEQRDAKPAVTLPGTVEKVIPPVVPGEPEKAQIALDGGEELYREIRIDNVLQDADGNEVKLKKGAEVEVTIEADPKATTPKK